MWSRGSVVQAVPSMLTGARAGLTRLQEEVAWLLGIPSGRTPGGAPVLWRGGGGDGNMVKLPKATQITQASICKADCQSA